MADPNIELQAATKDAVFTTFTVKDPKYFVANDAGVTASFDYFETVEKIDAIPGGQTMAERADEYRKIFGFPTSADVSKSTADPKPTTPSVHTMLCLAADFLEKFQGLDVLKKLRALTQS